jgi:aminoglycoside phosphotransferase family enzyme/predicted kinase
MNGQDEVIAFLADPQTFGVNTVETVETHISIVFLAGSRAYKLKRAVRYSYLDYASVERRRQACEAECAINRRFAPDLYLGVQPIIRTAEGAPQLGGAGSALDWVVVMRRFKQEDQFDKLAERGALTPDLITDFADILAKLHATAPRHEQAGGAAGIGRALDLTIENLELAIGAPFASEAVARWTGLARQAFAAQAALLDQRRRAGKVRACHGDLHLRNICLLDGQATPFDAIEFDPGLSTIDLLYDLAFLLMDLHARGLAQLGNRLFNRYLDRSDETEGLAALPLFLSLRAAVRAQVTAAARRQARESGKVQALELEAGRYLALACEFLAAEAPPCLLAVGGRSGTGKSTLAAHLAPDLGRPPGARVVRSDVVRKRAAGVALETSLPRAAYSPKSHEATYRGLAAEVRACLQAGQAVIADAVFGSSAERQAMEAVARDAGVPFRGLWLTAPEPVLLHRVAARTRDASDADAAVVREQGAHIDQEPAGWRRLDAAGGIETVLQQARAARAGTL